MSCAGKGYGTNPRSNSYLIAQFLSNVGNGSDIIKSSRNCRQLSKGFYPSFTPLLSSLSVTSSATSAYSLVYVNGANFLPYGTTFIQFGQYGYIPVTFYSSNNLSFVVPLNAVSGNYNIKVVNLYNGNFSPPKNQSYAGNLNYSNPITYTIT
jgi:hypothetical protein